MSKVYHLINNTTLKRHTATQETYDALKAQNKLQYYTVEKEVTLPTNPIHVSFEPPELEEAQQGDTNSNYVPDAVDLVTEDNKGATQEEE